MIDARRPDVAPPPAAPPARRSRRGLGAMLVQRLAGFAAFLTALAMLGLFTVADIARDLPNPSTARDPLRPPSITILDREGRTIAVRGPLVGALVQLDDLPPYLADAVIAIEDRRFFTHSGVDARSVARAIVANLRAGRIVEGGSTLTQQLAKNLFLDSRRTLERKVQEALLAWSLERRYSKAEVLELYLNRVYFGGGAWGVEAAAQRYFGKSAREIGLAEAAILAAVLKAPTDFSPVVATEDAAIRGGLVLDVMLAQGKITPEAHAAAHDAEIPVVRRRNPGRAGHFVDWIEREARELAPNARDLVVATTLDLDMQAAADAAVMRGLADDPALAEVQAALVALDGDGAVRAMVGSRDYSQSQFNRVWARRQPGSAFKTFVYAAAMEAGLTPATVRPDAPITVEGWSPTNLDGEFRGAMTLSEAFATSRNTVAVRVAQEIGRERVVRLARRLGLPGDLAPHPSLALGTLETAPIDLVAAYAAFANGGYAVAPYGLVSIADREGRVIWEREPAPAEMVLADRPRQLATHMLADAVGAGTGRRARLPGGRPSAGKTGTTNDHRDAWFVGFVPSFTAGVWVGRDDARPMDDITGGAVPARIWADFVAHALDGAPIEPLDLPPPGDAAVADDNPTAAESIAPTVPAPWSPEAGLIWSLPPEAPTPNVEIGGPWEPDSLSPEDELEALLRDLDAARRSEAEARLDRAGLEAVLPPG